VSVHGYLPPAKLAEYDLVITTYGVLSIELNYVDIPHNNSEEGRRFRNSKRYLAIPSPLPCVFWWRVCLDEAQMVEGIKTKMSMMAMRLQSNYRWVITGTPINEGLQGRLSYK
jgi:E3 ubiquitin-protein ligase SHPRH